MGDGGSLFLGGVLSLLTLHTQGQASNILSVVTLPTLILLVPIFDTLLVTFTRILRGQAISQGGRDHTSHRLVVLGLTESKAVLLLYLMAAISGATALLIESFSYTLSLALVPLVILSFALFTAYLAQVEIVAEEQGRKRAAERKLTTLLVTLTYKRRLFEIVLDFFLIVSAYYLAFALRFDFAMDERITALYLASIPVVLAATYSAFFFCGVYRGVWRYTDLEDLLRLAKGVAGGTLLTVAGVFLFSHFAGYSPTVFILYALLLFLSMTGSRLSFRLFTLLVARPRLKQVPVLIYGADDEGEIIVRECHKNPRLDYLPLGFLDDDLRKQGGEILGLPVLGGVEQLATVLEQKKVQGLIVASPGILANGSTEKLRVLCHKKNVWIKQLQVSFIEESEA
jgi:UDP-GlcNAc:undecaprenyl-phosphate GlcNAc-1-phosphate transferase